jgi:4-hydroxybenzoate polyprenyltransferase/phosphoserine phosphatase
MATENLVVDLDGTLVNTDLLAETLFLFLRQHPLRFLEVFVWLARGKAYLKTRLAAEVAPDVKSLPYNRSLLAWLRQRKSEGATLALATASDVRIARAIAGHLQIFDDVLGTESGINLSSHRKRAALVARYGEQGYAYVGNAHADVAVWRSANGIYVANPGRGVLAAARRLGEVKQVFDERPHYFRALLKAIRIHQWTKNVLIFVPLLAAHQLMKLPLVVHGLLAFLAFGACASSVYLLNDLLDLPDDRQHPTKYRRPLAAGTFPILHALVLFPTLLVLSFGLSLLLLPWEFAAVLLIYYVLTMAYSFRLKRIVMLDVVVLAMLYTVRVIAGGQAMDIVVTSWLLAFCMFIFLSLALVKRYTELYDARAAGRETKTAGRGYYPADFELLVALGGGAGYISVLVLALYINEAARGTLYHSPQWMWAACPLLLYWISRVWLLAHRGQMHDDPIVFALRDGVSRWVGLGFVVVFALAAL